MALSSRGRLGRPASLVPSGSGRRPWQPLSCIRSRLPCSASSASG